MTVGEKIKSFRAMAKITQKDLAKLSGVSEIAIKKYEAGERIPKPAQLKKIAEAFSLSENIFKIDTAELKTVGDAIALFLLLYKKSGIKMEYNSDEQGKIDPESLKFHFQNKYINKSLAEWIVNSNGKKFLLDNANAELLAGKITKEEYEKRCNITKGMYEIIEHSYRESKQLL